MHLLFLLTVYPLWRLWCANFLTSLRYAVYWTFAAWVAWGLLFFGLSFKADPEAAQEIRFVALCLTGCAGVAVLGARRPHAGAWNAVVLGLLAVLLTPWAEHRMLGTPLVSGLRAWFLGGILAIAVVNYLPTRFGLAAVLVGIGCTSEFVKLCDAESFRIGLADPASFCLILAPWAALVRRVPRTAGPFDALWLDFRDRYGLVWGQRVREQFNASMQHAGIPARLSWGGLVPLPDSPFPDENQAATARETLRALLKRFGPKG